MDIIEFTEYFDMHRHKVVNDAVNAYKKIGDVYLKNMEENTFETKTQGRREMTEYYWYWELWTFNAISIMILRAFAAINTIFSASVKTSNNARKPLIII